MWQDVSSSEGLGLGEASTHGEEDVHVGAVEAARHRARLVGVRVEGGCRDGERVRLVGRDGVQEAAHVHLDEQVLRPSASPQLR